MSATRHWCEDHGTATGSPAHGTTRDGFGADTNYPVNINWKAADDTNATAYTASALGSPGNSYEKWQYVHFTGTFNSIFNAKWTAHANFGDIDLNDASHLGKVTLWGAVLSAFTTPSRAANANLTTDFTKQVYPFNGIPVSFSTSGPEGASPTATLTAAGYTQYLVSQMRVASGVTTGTIITAYGSNEILSMLIYEEN